MRKLSLLLLSFCLSVFGDQKVKVVTSTTDLAWAAREIGGSLVEVTSLLNGTENPHYVDAVPEFVRLVADAEVVCIVGLDLEIGWIPKVLSRSGNATVQPGGKGYCETGKAVKVLEKPLGSVDRSMGDIHPGGNPHFWLSPSAFSEGASEIRDALIRVAPPHANEFKENYIKLSQKLQALQKENRVKLDPLLPKGGFVAIEYHKEFTYFFDAYGIRSLGSIEEKPGVPPSAGRIAEVAMSAKNAKVRIALGGEYSPKKVMERITELSGIPSFELPTSIQKEGKVNTYPALQALLVETIAANIRLASQPEAPKEGLPLKVVPPKGKGRPVTQRFSHE